MARGAAGVVAAGRVSQVGRRSPAAAGIGVLRGANSGAPTAGVRRGASGGLPRTGRGGRAAPAERAAVLAEAAPPARWLLTTAARPAARLPGAGPSGAHGLGGMPAVARPGEGCGRVTPLRPRSAPVPSAAGPNRSTAAEASSSIPAPTDTPMSADSPRLAESPSCADRLTSISMSRLRPADSSKPALRSKLPPLPMMLEAPAAAARLRALAPVVACSTAWRRRAASVALTS